MTTNRALLYVHFNKKNHLDDYVVNQLQQMSPLFSKVVFITNSKFYNKDLIRLSGLYDEFIQRKNKGYDFAAWRDGINKVGWKELEQYDSVTFMNDTCFGPLYPIPPVYEEMDKKGVDFWGMTMHNGSERGMPGTNGPVPKHIQSYFMTFSRRVVKSKLFQGFWEGVVDAENVEFVIQNYETKLTGILARSFTYDAFVKHSDTLPDITYSKPKTLVDSGLPFVKVKALMDSTDSITPWGLTRYIKRRTDASTKYMKKYINKNLSCYTRRSFKKAVYYIRECLKTKR